MQSIREELKREVLKALQVKHRSLKRRVLESGDTDLINAINELETKYPEILQTN